MRTSVKLPLAVLAAGAAGLGWSLAEAQAYTLRRFSVPVLPAGSSPLRVLCLSDLHLVPNQTKKLDWVRGLAALEPDLVVSTGDNLAHLEAVPAVLRAHEHLLKLPGVFVLGSNDYFAPRPKNPARYLLPYGGKKRIHGVRLPTRELVEGFSEGGWIDLNNRREQLKINDLQLEFVGVDDPHIKKDRYSEVAGQADPTAALTIGVAHAPYLRVLDAMTADGAGLILAGHTHGGQLCVPGYGALTTNCDLDRRRAKGVSRYPGNGSVPTDAWMHVSAGLGTSPYTPVRFACRPEATLLTLTAAA
ncbi:metallophosphoesterase [Kineosporia sp. NBRC 101731]|uniref:metallophosphoesterase n=1 Tax=Kineosporia sp. NBRC 101731 TaxID=3032199 RepID=UPI0024A0FB00|nr:metallophosphoesterase [Kineosporia sp. NBRC 101731]GLY33586.1 metallophosphoesterase [Kineosporia sp. NBRC 101731]